MVKGYEVQTGGLVFKDLKTKEIVEVANNEYMPLTTDCISFNSVGNYIGQKFDVDFKYLLHLCNEGTRDYKCKGWVITGISSQGMKLVEDLNKIPFIGRLEDKDGYVNVRKSMNAKSAILGRLNSNDEVLRYY